VRALLDTHVFVWAATDDPRLSAVAREIVRVATNELLLSAASVYELTWKAANGDLSLPGDAATWIRTRMQAFSLRPLAVTADHAVSAALLPQLHRDPWDRLLIAQAMAEGIPLVTIDSRIRRYDVEILW
jgi:PIN domain nuclease of toxin-antitoxin system